MTIHQAEMVQNSFPRVLARMINKVGILYEKLFELAPETKELFKNTSMERQSQMLVAAVGRIVKSIDKWEAIKADLQALAQRHASYGLSPEHFVYFGQAFIYMLQALFEDEWNSDLEESWRAVYQKVSEVMIETLFAKT